MIFDLINTDPGFASSHNLEDLPGAGTYPFLSVDSRDDFEESLRVKPEDWYYRNNPVEYRLNSQQFRTKEFKDIDWKNSIVILGCSLTFGVGVTEEHTIASYLQKITGKYVVNLGHPGLTNGLIAYNSYYLKENYPTPLSVVNLWTHMVRSFYIIPKTMRLEVKNFHSISAKDMNTIITNNIMWMKMSNSLWKDHPNHVQLCLHDYFNDGKPIAMAQKVFPEVVQLKESWQKDESARDNWHWGKETCEEIAKLIASNIKL